MIHVGLRVVIINDSQNQKLNDRALAKIGMSPTALLQPRVTGFLNAKAAYEKLVKDFGEQGVAGQLILERRLYRAKRRLCRARLEDFKSVDEYINYVLAVRSELADCGAAVTDDKIGSMLLHGLPDSCTPLILAYGAANKKVTLESVLDFLHNYDEGTRDRQSETALAAN